MKKGTPVFRFGIIIASVLLTAVFAFNSNMSSYADDDKSKNDWPQWRGPNRDGISRETGLLKSWPEGGPKVLWRAPFGEGFSGIAIANGRGYTMDAQGDAEFAVCFDAATGKEIWRFKVDAKFINDQGNGPRSTPTVDGDLMFTLSGDGKLHALQTKSGEKVWEHDIRNEFGGKVPTWGISATPLVEGNLLILDVGGDAGYSVVAFDKKTGEVAWKSETDQPGYSAPIAITVNGVRQVVVFTGTSLIALAPTDGKLYWKYPWVTSLFVNAATPIFIPENKIFISSGYDKGSALVQVQAANGRATVQPVWVSKAMKNHFSSSILHEGYLYGFDDFLLTCLEVSTGKTQWQQRGFQKGSLIFADGYLLVLGERGNLALVEAMPSAYTERANAQILKGKCWTVPSLANGKLYLRNEKEMLCLDVTGKNL